MEIAFSTFLILAVILPGFLFNIALFSPNIAVKDGAFSRQSFLEKIPFSLMYSFMFHLMGFLVMKWWLNGNIDINKIISILAGQYGKDGLFLHTNSVSFIHTVYYFIVITFFAWFTGFILRVVIKRYGLDLKFPGLRIDPDWYYLLSGDKFLFRESKLFLKTPDAITLDTIIHHTEGDYLYSGLLFDYKLDIDGEIEYVILLEARRRKLSNDKDQLMRDKAIERYYRIDGDYFVIKKSEMVTMNFLALFIGDYGEGE